MQNGKISSVCGSEPLVRHIRSLISQSPIQAIPFRTFMAACLYHETYGYYTRDTIKIGKEGDFYTSSSVGTIMGEMLAKAFIRMIREAGWDRDGCCFVEWGGGSGRLAVQILDTLRGEAPDLYGKSEYVIVERSPFHRSLQREALRQHGAVKFALPEEWLAADVAGPCIVFSNELLDAFPVHRIRCRDGRFEEIHVTWDEKSGQFTEIFLPIGHGPLMDYIRTEGIPARNHQHFEINLDAIAWIRAIADKLREGALVTVDYGDVGEELYASHRMNGTLMCYRKHLAHDNPYIFIGEQDITSHVNFSACIRAGEAAGFGRWSLMTQREFLVEAGILELLRNHDEADPFSPVARKNRSIRQLLLSDGMSELFKVLIQTK